MRAAAANGPRLSALAVRAPLGDGAGVEETGVLDDCPTAVRRLLGACHANGTPSQPICCTINELLCLLCAAQFDHKRLQVMTCAGRDLDQD